MWFQLNNIIWHCLKNYVKSILWSLGPFVVKFPFRLDFLCETRFTNENGFHLNFSVKLIPKISMQMKIPLNFIKTNPTFWRRFDQSNHWFFSDFWCVFGTIDLINLITRVHTFPLADRREVCTAHVFIIFEILNNSQCWSNLATVGLVWRCFFLTLVFSEVSLNNPQALEIIDFCFVFVFTRYLMIFTGF